METDPVFVEVAAIISEGLSVSLQEVTPTASFINDLGADSLDLMELEMSLEEKYKISISEKELQEIKTVQDVVNFIKKTKA